MRRALILIVVLLATAAGVAVASTEQLTLLAEPSAGVAPFRALIRNARRSIDLVIYELRDPSVQSALVAAEDRGVHVRVLLDRTYSGARDNAAAYGYLRAHGVPVRWAPAANHITHQKTLTVDGAVAAVMTLNFDGLYASTRDFAVIDRRPRDVTAIDATFNADWDGTPIVPTAGSGDLVWSPGASATVLSLIRRARSSIDLENEEMDDRPATAALCAAARRGVAVRIVMTYSPEWRSALDELSGCGAHVHLYHGQSYYIHAKILEVDGARALIGSQNLSAESLDDNRELGILVTDRAVLSQLVAAFDSDDRGG